MKKNILPLSQILVCHNLKIKRLDIISHYHSNKKITTQNTFSKET